MKQESIFSKVWRVLTPLVTYYLLQLIVMIGVSAAFAMKFVGQVDVNGANLDSVYRSLMESVFNSMWDISFWCTVLSAAAILPLLLLYRKRDRKRAAALGRTVRYTKAAGFAVPLFALLACAVALGADNIMLVTGLLRGSTDGAVSAGYGQSVMMTIIGMGVIMPVAEEMIFRVVMYERVRDYVRPLYAGIITSAIYASLHMGMVQMVYAFLLGALFSYAYEKTHDWKIPALMHVCLNVVDILITDTQLFRFMYSSRAVLIGITLAACAAVTGLMYLAETKISTEPVEEREENRSFQ